MDKCRRATFCVLVICLQGAGLLASGCSSGTRFSSDDRLQLATQQDNTPPRYQRAFRRGDFATAAKLASQAPRRDARARLIEGMSRAELGERDRAAVLLRPLLRSSDADIKGRAAATLGLIELAGGNRGEASRLLQLAADHLDGNDQAWALRYADQARDTIGRPEAGARSVPSLPSAAGDYEIQFGSFSTEARAQRHAQAVTRLTRTTGLDLPRVESVQRGGRTLYAVRVGSFGSRSAAADAASRLQTDTAVVRTN
ncbi:MAG: SPOR domain-containing protein [Planctomycetota bacterium]